MQQFITGVTSAKHAADGFDQLITRAGADFALGHTAVAGQDAPDRGRAGASVAS